MQVGRIINLRGEVLNNDFPFVPSYLNCCFGTFSFDGVSSIASKILKSIPKLLRKIHPTMPLDHPFYIHKVSVLEITESFHHPEIVTNKPFLCTIKLYYTCDLEHDPEFTSFEMDNRNS